MSNEVSERHISVARTARYFVLGDRAQAADVWFVCHGYGQLAARFLKRFVPIADGSRLVVAPEGLSRFYVGSGERRDQPVGATWMTREDRLNEIADYVKYLDAVYADVVGDRVAPVRVRALGFSQGAATASRWAALGTARLDELVLWGGELPPDLDLAAAAARLAGLRITLVAGTQDEYITPKVLAGMERRLREQGIPFQTHVFEGGHEIEPGVLRLLADG